MRALCYLKGKLTAIEFNKCQSCRDAENYYLRVERSTHPRILLFNFGSGDIANRNIDMAIIDAIKSYVDLTKFDVLERV